MRQPIILFLIIFNFLFLIAGCNNLNESYVSVQVNNETRDISLVSFNGQNTTKKILEISGRTENISKDKNQLVWIPLEYEKDISVGNNKVLIVKDNKVIKTINNLPYYPVKVIIGPKNINAILCTNDGITGKVVFVDKSTFEIIKTVNVKGNITDGTFDIENLYIVSDDLVNLGPSWLHKISLNDYNLTTVVLDGLYTPSITQSDQDLFIAMASRLNSKDTSSYIVKISKSDFEKQEYINVPFSPYKLILKDEMLYVLHISLTSNFGGILSIIDLKNNSVTDHSLGIYANKMTSISNDKLIISSTITGDFGIFNQKEKKWMHKPENRVNTLSNFIELENN